MSAVIYGKKNCAFCEQAKGLCIIRGIEMEYKDLNDGDYTMEEFNETFPGARTFPQIIYNGEKVGGFTEFAAASEPTGE